MSEVVNTSAAVKASFSLSICRFLSMVVLALCKPNLIIGSKQAFAAENLILHEPKMELCCGVKRRLLKTEGIFKNYKFSYKLPQPLSP